MGDAGFLLTIPAPYMPTRNVVPTAREVVPRVSTIQRLWRDVAIDAKSRTLVKAEAKRWGGERLGEQCERFFGGVVQCARPRAGREITLLLAIP
jgi:hypothetical protein